MAYDMTKEEMIEHLYLDAEYFPFEQIRQFKNYKSQEPHIPFDRDLERDYFAFFEDVREQCEILLKTEPNFEEADVWKEAIEEINKLIRTYLSDIKA